MADTVDKYVLQLTADNREAVSKIGQVQTKMEGMGKSSGGVFAGLKKNWLAVTAIWTGVIAIVGKVGKAIFDAAAKQEASDRKLARSLANVGDVSQKTFDKLRNFAGELQRTTTIGDEAAQDLMSLGLAYGVTTDKIEEATKGAIGLSAAFGIDQSAAMKLTAQATMGNYDALTRYLPALKGATTEAEKAAIVQKAMADGFKIAQDEINTTAGRMKQLKNIMGDVQEIFGFALTRAITPMIDGFRDFISSAEGMETITSLARGLAYAFAVVKTAVMAVVNTIRTLININKTAAETVAAIFNAIKTGDWKGAVGVARQGVEDMAREYAEGVARHVGVFKDGFEEIKAITAMSNEELRSSGVKAVEAYGQAERTKTEILGEQLDARVEMTAEAERSMAEIQMEQANTAIGLMNMVAGAFEDGSKEQFEAQKIASAGSTLVAGIEGAQKAFTSLAGISPVVGAAAATAATAFTVASVARILSAQYGGGGKPPSPSAAAPKASASPSAPMPTTVVRSGKGGGPVIEINAKVVDEMALKEFSKDVYRAIEGWQTTGEVY